MKQCRELLEPPQVEMTTARPVRANAKVQKRSRIRAISSQAAWKQVEGSEIRSSLTPKGYGGNGHPVGVILQGSAAGPNSSAVGQDMIRSTLRDVEGGGNDHPRFFDRVTKTCSWDIRSIYPEFQQGAPVFGESLAGRESQSFQQFVLCVTIGKDCVKQPHSQETVSSKRNYLLETPKALDTKTEPARVDGKVREDQGYDNGQSAGKA